MPPRVILAVATVGLVGLAVWGVRAAARATRVSPAQRLLGGGLVVVVMTALQPYGVLIG